jgi:hypothetical protein
VAATTNTISVTNDSAAPEQAVPVDLTLSGTYAGSNPAYIEAVVRPAGGLGCQASYLEDVSTLGSEDTTIVAPGGTSVSAMNYSVGTNFKPPTPGSYQVCAWLSQNPDGSLPLAGPATVSLTARGPQVSQLVVTAPKTLTPNVPFQISYLMQSDQQLNLLSVIAKAGAAPCAPAYEQQAHPVTTVFGNGRQQVFGGPITTMASVTERLEGVGQADSREDRGDQSLTDRCLGGDGSRSVTPGRRGVKTPPRGARVTRGAPRCRT